MKDDEEARKIFYQTFDDTFALIGLFQNRGMDINARIRSIISYIAFEKFEGNIEEWDFIQMMKQVKVIEDVLKDSE